MSFTDLDMENITTIHSFTDLLNYKISIKFIIFTLSIFGIFLVIVLVLVIDDITKIKDYVLNMYAYVIHNKRTPNQSTTNNFDDKKKKD